MASGAKKEELYGIGAVAKLTGLTDHTIRVWERRYAAVVAQRASNGRRVYKPADVEKLGLLKRLTDQGLSIGQIADYSVDELRARAQSLNEMVSAPVPDHIGVAILGEFLPNQFAAHLHDVAPVEVLVADNTRDRFIADFAGQYIFLICSRLLPHIFVTVSKFRISSFFTPISSHLALFSIYTSISSATPPLFVQYNCFRHASPDSTKQLLTSSSLIYYLCRLGRSARQSVRDSRWR